MIKTTALNTDSCTKRCGFSLIEVVVATIIVMLAIFSLGVLIPLTQVRSRDISHQDVAIVLAESMIEKIRVLDWAYIFPENKSVGNSRVFDGRYLIAPNSYKPEDNMPAKINPSTPLFPPPPYPRTSYELMAGELSKGSHNETDVKRHIDYYYRVTTVAYEIPPLTSSTVSPSPQNMLRITVAVYWTESTGVGGSRERCFTISSSIYGEQ
ncbi:MAG: hypothetical protein AB2L14_16315 [Candidatus Xenobiia bacterium LiM19]